MAIENFQSFGDIIDKLPSLASDHARTSPIYEAIDGLAKSLVAASGFTSEIEHAVSFGNFGLIKFPYVKMGAISTLDLFGLDELIIFSFYWINRNRYRNAADIGANLGLHSILMAKCGWQVDAYEPDPEHAARLRRNLELNDIATVKVCEVAVSDFSGTLEFVRVLGNTTSSHLAGAKDSAYGPLEKFPVNVESISNIMPTVNFVKMDAEGQERTIILGTTAEHWIDTEMMVEVGSSENANAIYDHLKKIGVRAFAQKLGWGEVLRKEDMPTHYKQGSLFISQQSNMPWG